MIRIDLRTLALAAALALAGASAGAVAPPSAAPVVAAERAFAADGRAHGVRESFLRSVADDGVILRPEAVNAREFLTAQPADPPDSPELFWWPVWAGISAAGDLGVSSGPVTIAGRHTGSYFTVWKRQANGTWRWLFDAGSGAFSPLPLADPAAEPAYLPPSVGHAASPAAAMAEVRAAEAALAAGVRADQRATFPAVVGQGARILVARLPPGMDQAGIATALAGWPASFEFDRPAGGSASDSADLVWVYGPARWTRDGAPGHGQHVHAWQHQEGGWRLIFAEIVAAPP